jgi:hypothetical protein
LEKGAFPAYPQGAKPKYDRYKVLITRRLGMVFEKSKTDFKSTKADMSSIFVNGWAQL